MYISMPISNTRTVFLHLWVGAKSSKMDKTLNKLLIFPLTTTRARQGCHTLCTGHLRLSARLPACTATHKKQAT
jgi:hypothetical protein